MGRRLAYWWCWLVTGHSPLPRFYRERLCLECSHCGFQTSGWEIERKPLTYRKPRASVRRRALQLARKVG